MSHSALAALLFAVASPASGSEPSVGRFPITFHVAPSTDARSDGEWFLPRALDVANGHFGLHGLCFREIERRALPTDLSVLRTVRDRRGLGRRAVPRTINVFLVDRILDAHASTSTVRAAARAGFEPTGLLSGAHVPAPGRTPGTYILLSRQASDVALTHELGHFFGAGHHPDPTNIMSYGAERNRFDERQVRAFRAFGLRYARRGWLRPVDRERCP